MWDCAIRICGALALALVTGLGCAEQKPYKTAAVSGRVTLDGQPLAGATVSFTPVLDPRAALSGPGAHGDTDADGKFSLKTMFNERGATVGKNRVFVSTRRFDRPPDPGDGREAKVKMTSGEKVPQKYFTKDKFAIYIDVPATGTMEANIDLTSK